MLLREESPDVGREDYTVRPDEHGLREAAGKPAFSWEGSDRGEGWWHVRLRGELDLAGSDALDSAIRRVQFDGKPRVLLDLQELTFLDCSGLRAILQAVKRSDELGGEVKLVRGPRPVQRVFEITGVIDRLEFVEP